MVGLHCGYYLFSFIADCSIDKEGGQHSKSDSAIKLPSGVERVRWMFFCNHSKGY